MSDDIDDSVFFNWVCGKCDLINVGDILIKDMRNEPMPYMATCDHCKKSDVMLLPPIVEVNE
jgi:hypothetical protein